MNKPKILYVSANGYIGGAEQFVYNALKGHLASTKLESELLCFNNGPLIKKCADAGIKTYVLPQKFRFSRPLKLLRALFFLRKHIKKNQYQIIHSTMPYSFIMVFIACLFLNIKHVWFQHGPVGSFWDYLGNLFSPDLLYFNSNFLKNEHLKMPLSSRFEKKHQVLNLGVSHPPLNEDKINQLKLSYQKDQYLLVSAGRINQAKGYNTILEALQILGLKSPYLPQIQLLIIGSAHTKEEKKYAKELHEMVATNHLDKIVHFIHHVDDLHNYLSACDIYIQATNVPESFGLGIAEAMLQKCLVIGPNFGGVTCILQNEVTGLTFSSNKKSASLELSDLLINIFDKKLNTKNLALNASKYIQQHHDYHQMIKTLESDYLKLLS